MSIVVDVNGKDGYLIFTLGGLVLAGVVYHPLTIFSSKTTSVISEFGRNVPQYREQSRRRDQIGIVVFLLGLIGSFILIFTLESPLGVFALALFIVGLQCPYCGKINNSIDSLCRNCNLTLEE
jgi:dolichol kinase